MRTLGAILLVLLVLGVVLVGLAWPLLILMVTVEIS